MTPELEKACGKLCREAGEQGVPLFILYVDDHGDTGYLGLGLPGELIAKMLRSVASVLEKRLPPETLN